MRLSACLIVRNEERFLEGGLTSLSGLVDEIVIVDTGSTDRSLEIARDHGAVLIEDPWRHDFAYARNLGLEQASGDWILYFDADEVLHANPQQLVELEEPDVVAATVRFRPASHQTPYRENRLFRNRADIRFRGVIHETILPSIDAVVESENARIVHTEAYIEHLGYEGDLTHKHHRNRPLLLAGIKEWPERFYLWHALGECELGLGHYTQAESAWREGLKLVRECRGDPRNALVYQNLFALHFHPSSPPMADIEELVAEAVEEHEDDPLVQWWLARVDMEQRNLSSARHRLSYLTHPGTRVSHHEALAYDRRIFGAYSFALLGNCAFLEDDIPLALEFFERALAEEPENTEIRTKRDFTRARMAGSGLSG